jgi:hypothetical protein
VQLILDARAPLVENNGATKLGPESLPQGQSYPLCIAAPDSRI